MDDLTSTPQNQPNSNGSDPEPVRAARIGSSPFNQIQTEITASVGRTRPLIRDLVHLERGAVLPLDKRIDDPVELYVGDRLIGRGTLLELEGDETGRLAVSLSEVADLGSGI